MLTASSDVRRPPVLLSRAGGARANRLLARRARSAPGHRGGDHRRTGAVRSQGASVLAVEASIEDGAASERAVAAAVAEFGTLDVLVSNAGVEALAHTLAREQPAHGVRVDIVAPGLVDTDMGRRLARATRDVSDIHELDDRSPFGRVCAPGDAARTVRFLVGPESG